MTDLYIIGGKTKMTDLEKLRMIKNSVNRNVEFWLTGYTDSLNTSFADNSFAFKDELVDLLLDTAIKYLEKKNEKKINNSGR